MVAGILVAVLVIGVLIAFHEFGHFVFAKLFGVGVERFSVGFGPILFSKKVGKTEYALSVIPLGGYVKMVGEGDSDEKPANPEKSFDKKPVWKHILIILAGPGFNILLAFLLYTVAYFVYGIPTLTTKIGEVTKNSSAEKAGLATGDVVLGVQTIPSMHGDGFTPVRKWEELTDFIKKNETKELKFLVVKNGIGPALEIRIRPEFGETKNIFGETVRGYFIGIQPADPVFVKDAVKAIPQGILRTSNMATLIVVGIWKMFFGSVKVADSVGGPIQIVQVLSQIMGDLGLMGVLFFSAAISVNLAILNLLPIPMLDGGHIPFLLAEGIRGKPVSKNVRERAFTVGLILLLLLMIFATFNDILRFFR